MNLNYHFGQNLEKYLIIKKITAVGLSEKMKVSHQAIAKYIKSKTPREETLNKILSALEVSFEEFNKVVTEEEEKSNNAEERYKSKYEQQLQKNAELQDLLLKYQQKEIEELKKQKANRGETSIL